MHLLFARKFIVATLRKDVMDVRMSSIECKWVDNLCEYLEQQSSEANLMQERVNEAKRIINGDIEQE